MKLLKKKALLKLGVVALLLFASVVLAAATKGNSTLICSAIPSGDRTCSAGDAEGIIGVVVWNKDTGKKTMDMDYHNFAPISVDFTIPGTGNFTVELKDNQKKHAKDFFIVNSTGAWGPFAKKPKNP